MKIIQVQKYHLKCAFLDDYSNSARFALNSCAVNLLIVRCSTNLRFIYNYVNISRQKSEGKFGDSKTQQHFRKKRQRMHGVIAVLMIVKDSCIIDNNLLFKPFNL